jgi:hypothetical protein
MTDCRERRLDLSLISNLPAKAAADHLSHSYLPPGSELHKRILADIPHKADQSSHRGATIPPLKTVMDQRRYII